MSFSEVESEAPKIEFPCEYPIKVLGVASVRFQADVLEIVHRHTNTVSRDKITERASRKGNYISITIVIEATGEEQLKNLFEDLMRQENVKLVL